MVVRKKRAKRSGLKKVAAAKALKTRVASLKKEHKSALKKAVAKAYKDGLADGKKKAGKKSPVKKRRKVSKKK